MRLPTPSIRSIDWSVTTDAGDLLIAIIDEMGSFTIIRPR
jgi:hypothetical protein